MGDIVIDSFHAHKQFCPETKGNDVGEFAGVTVCKFCIGTAVQVQSPEAVRSFPVTYFKDGKNIFGDSHAVKRAYISLDGMIVFSFGKAVREQVEVDS